MTKIMGTTHDEDVMSNEDLEAIYTQLNAKLGEVIGKHANGKSLNVCMPILDSLACNAVSTIMMCPQDMRQQMLLTFASRLKSFFTAAVQEEESTKSPIITLN